MTHKLDVTRELTVSLWRVKEAEFEVACYIWCSREPNRSLPRRVPIAAESIDIDTKLSLLVSAPNHTVLMVWLHEL